MTIQDLINEAYEDTNTSVASYSHDKALKKLNDVYKEIWRMIISTHEDYFWTYRLTDIQEGATEYNIQRKETILLDEFGNPVLDEQGNQIKVPGIEKVKKVFVEGKEIALLSDGQETAGVRGYVLKDNHIILNWTPSASITDGLKIEGIQSINNAVLTDDESVFFPGHEDLQDFTKVLIYGLKAELWEHKQDFEKADRVRVRYNEELEKMRRYITERTQGIYYSELY